MIVFLVACADPAPFVPLEGMYTSTQIGDTTDCSGESELRAYFAAWYTLSHTLTIADVKPTEFVLNWDYSAALCGLDGVTFECDGADSPELDLYFYGENEELTPTGEVFGVWADESTFHLRMLSYWPDASGDGIDTGVDDACMHMVEERWAMASPP